MRVIAPGAAGVPAAADERRPEVTNAWLSLAHDEVGAGPGPAAPTASSGLPPDRAVRATGCGASAPRPDYRSYRKPGLHGKRASVP